MDLHNRLLDLIRHSDHPLTAGEVHRRIADAELSPTQVRTALEELSSWGQLSSFHGWGKAALFATKQPLDLCADALQQLVACAGKPLKTDALVKRLPRSLAPWAEEALGRLIVKGQAFYVPSKTGETLVQARQPRPTDALSKTQLKSLEAILAKVNAERKSPRSLDQLLAWLDDSTAATPTARPALSRELLAQWHALDSGRGCSTTVVPLVKTYAHYDKWIRGEGLEPDLAEFKNAIRSMYDDGHAILEPPERPGSLTDEERQLLVPVCIGPPGYAWSLVC
jgi:hypothetical protein